VPRKQKPPNDFLPDESWIHYRDGYWFSNLGRASGPNGHVLKPVLVGSGQDHQKYLAVMIHRKSISLHRIICELFHGPAPSLKHVTAHTNGIKSDNRAENLRWATYKENTEDARGHGTLLFGTKAPANKLKEQEVLEIKAALKHKYRGQQRELAIKYGVTSTAILKIEKGVNWSWLS
jgi:hypothetical protein